MKKEKITVSIDKSELPDMINSLIKSEFQLQEIIDFAESLKKQNTTEKLSALIEILIEKSEEFGLEEERIKNLRLN